MQAGVAMGLAKTVAVRFPEWGPEFATLMVSCLALAAVSTAYHCMQHHSCAVVKTFKARHDRSGNS